MHGLARSKPSFKAASLVGIVTIALRPLIAAEFSDKLLTVFVLNILSVPAIIHHLNVMSPEVCHNFDAYTVNTELLDYYPGHLDYPNKY